VRRQDNTGGSIAVGASRRHAGNAERLRRIVALYEKLQFLR
jgi:hypothetical protein